MTIRSSLKVLTSCLFPEILNRQLRSKALHTLLTEDYPFEPEAKLIREIAPLHQPFFDIGANYGFYSILVEDLLGAENVYSFEPLRQMYLELKRRRNSSRIFNFAMSDIEEMAIIKIPFINGKRFDTRATLENDIVETDETGYEKTEILTTTIDRFIAKHGLTSLGFLKIDVEGHERHVIEGGIQSIKAFRPIMMIEIEQRHHRIPNADIFASIESMGFRGYYLNALEFKLCPVAHFLSERDQQFQKHKTLAYINNFLFVPEETHEVILKKASNFLQNEKRAVEQFVI